MYCASNKSTTADHIFAREFFPESERNNLPKIPSCQKCNSEKSVLEHYLTSVLPFGGRHANASQSLLENVPKRLEKNRKLASNLAKNQALAFVDQGEKYLGTAFILPFDGTAYTALFGLIAKGLLYYHFDAVLNKDCQVQAYALSDFGEMVFSKLLNMRGATQISNRISGGEFVYQGLQGADYPELSVWRMEVFGGVTLAGDSAEPYAQSNTLGMITARNDFFDGEVWRSFFDR